MSRSKVSTRMIWGSATLAASLSAACADNDQTLYIRGILKPRQPMCEVQNNPSGTYVGRGVLDTAFRLDYGAWVLAANQLVSRAEVDSLRTETNHIVLEGAEVRLSDSRGDIPDGYFTVSGAGFVDVVGGNTPGYGFIRATLIPSVVGDAMRDELRAQGIGASREVTARFRVFGTTLGGITVDSSEYTFPIDVCYGCLVQFPLEAIGMNPDGSPNCLENAEGVQDTSCGQGQDDEIDCRSCLGNEVCDPSEL